ncbi:hypothetical protein Gotri_024140 [Gossypium trilobum]|uniref:RNase H type-1 domain-containing protein n=1 Tax=Gossypium trilobum TaxID=34281 RepID=A0A7J9DLF5_9ROSI|nr:hypothetical protein [Gossypium trilobum]
MNPHEDHIIWRGEPTGEYSCRLIACAMWAIWTVRNKFLHEGEQKTGSQLVDLVFSYLKELDGLNIHLPGNGLLMGRQTAPTGSTVKINFDTAFNRQRKESCSKLVVRNEKAEVICSRTVMHENIPSIFAIEAMVCLQAIHLGLNLGLGMVEIEGDAHTMIRKLQAKEVFINDSKQLCSSFGSCVFRFTYRESNKAGHILATEGLKRRETTYLMNDSSFFRGEKGGCR